MIYAWPVETKPKVILRQADRYNPDEIAGIINPLFRFDLIVDAYPFLFWTWFKRLVKGRF